MPWRELPPEISIREAQTLTDELPRPVAVTGATGFIGSHVLETLVRAGVPCRVLVRDPARLKVGAHGVQVVAGDLETTPALERLTAGCPVLLHLAGVVRAARAESFDRANRLGTETVIAAAARTSPACRVVLVSSQAAVGPSPTPQGRMPEDGANPVSAYGRSKLAAEAAVRKWTGGNWAIVRPPAVYGPRDVDVLQFFRLAAKGLVPVPSGERWVTMAHVSDVVRGVLLAAAPSCDRQAVQLGHPEPLLMTDLVRRLSKAGSVRARMVRVPPGIVRLAGWGGDLLHVLGMRGVAMTSDKARELLARHWTMDTAGSLAMLGLDGAVPFEQGAASTWAWYRTAGWLPRGTIPPV